MKPPEIKPYKPPSAAKLKSMHNEYNKIITNFEKYKATGKFFDNCTSTI